MKTISFLVILVSGLSVIISSCSKSDAGNNGGGNGSVTFSCTGISPKFSTDVQPILTSVCSINSNCHAAGSINSGGPFTNYSEVFAKKTNIRAAILSGTMPQSGTITQAQINAFICWIDGGAVNN